MNGHHKDCECQPCTIGREIGMDRALELIKRMRDELADGIYLMNTGHRLEGRFFDSITQDATAFLAEHSGETE